MMPFVACFLGCGRQFEKRILERDRAFAERFEIMRRVGGRKKKRPSQLLDAGGAFLSNSFHPISLLKRFRQPLNGHGARWFQKIRSVIFFDRGPNEKGGIAAALP
jgi:hypothetical protein